MAAYYSIACNIASDFQGRNPEQSAFVASGSAGGTYTYPMLAGRPPRHRRSPFGRRLFALRQRRGLSQTQLAARLGVTQQAYAGWERATVALRPENIARLATVLGVSADELVGINAKHHTTTPLRPEIRRLLEQLGRLPKARQRQILRALEALVDGSSPRPRQTRNGC